MKLLLIVLYSGFNMKIQNLAITEASQEQSARRQGPKELRTPQVDTVRPPRVLSLQHPKELTAKRTRSRTRTFVIWPPSRRRLDAGLRLRRSGGTPTCRSSAVETGEGTRGEEVLPLQGPGRGIQVVQATVVYWQAPEGADIVKDAAIWDATA